MNMSNFTKIITSYTLNFQNFSCVFTILVKFDIYFLRIPWEIFFGVSTDDHLHLSLVLEKCKKNATFLRAAPRYYSTLDEEIVKTWPGLKLGENKALCALVTKSLV